MTGQAGAVGRSRSEVRLGRSVRDPSAKAVLAVMAGADHDPRGLVEAVADGLAPRDRLLWELCSTSSLTGAQLADAAGVPPSQIYTVLNRMRRRAWRAMGAAVLASSPDQPCEDLATVLGRCDRDFSPLVRKRIARHLDRCDGCHDRVAEELHDIAGTSVPTRPTR